MVLQEASQLSWFEFAALQHPGLTQAIFTRAGGVSPSPWASLNTGGSVGDAAERVLENRRRIFSAVDLPFDSIYDVWQVHQAAIVTVAGPRRGGPLLQADGMITDRPDVSLFMRFADCVPIFLFDPRNLAIGIVHAGWMGTVLKVASSAVRSMVAAYGCKPSEMVAGLGPSIACHHYPVGPEVVEQVRSAFPGTSEQHLETIDGKVCFDLWSANRALLVEEGLAQIEVAGICTACDPARWYSHRGEHGRTGRLGALISLKS